MKYLVLKAPTSNDNGTDAVFVTDITPDTLAYWRKLRTAYSRARELCASQGIPQPYKLQFWSSVALYEHDDETVELSDDFAVMDLDPSTMEEMRTEMGLVAVDDFGLRFQCMEKHTDVEHWAKIGWDELDKLSVPAEKHWLIKQQAPTCPGGPFYFQKSSGGWVPLEEATVYTQADYDAHRVYEMPRNGEWEETDVEQ